MTGTDDDRLVRLAQAGNREAFGWLVERHQDRMYRLMLRMVGAEVAEDLAQQAFLKAWLGLARFQGDSTFGTWLYRLAVNVCLDELRRSARRVRLLPLEVAELAGDHEPDVADQVADGLAAQARQIALAAALDQVSAEDRLLLHLRVGEGLSYEDIGQLLSIPPSTVGTRLFRARARLHALVTAGLLLEDPHGVR
jgi:RNA polymerase sigma-70 factor (ECF subfamily)